eukprot:g7686.t1
MAANGFLGFVEMQRQEGVSAKAFLSQFGLSANVDDDERLWELIVEAGPALLMRHAPDPVRAKLPQYNTLDDAVSLLKGARKVMVLSGAGISVACGIPDFRSKGGLYDQLEKYGLPDPQCMFDRRFFNRNPRPFFHFATKIFPFGPQGSPFVPSATHFFLAALERRGQLLRNYTQNIDQIELKAGLSRESLVFCHGSFETVSCARPDGNGKGGCGYKCQGAALWPAVRDQRVPLCPRCGGGDVYAPLHKPEPKSGPPSPDPADAGADPSTLSEGALRRALAAHGVDSAACAGREELELRLMESRLSAGGSTAYDSPEPKPEPEPARGVLKPDIVFFGEPLGDAFHDAIERDMREVDLVLVMGSSLSVGPVNSIPARLPEHVPAILINREVVGAPSKFDIELLGDCDAIVTELASRAGFAAGWADGAAGGGAGGAARRCAGMPNPFYWVEGHVQGARGSDRADPWYWQRQVVRGSTCAFEVARPHTMVFAGGVAPRQGDEDDEDEEDAESGSEQGDEEERLAHEEDGLEEGIGGCNAGMHGVGDGLQFEEAGLSEEEVHVSGSGSETERSPKRPKLS